MESSKIRVADVKTCKDYRLHEPEAEMYRQLCALLDVDRCYIGTEAGVEGAILVDEVRRAGSYVNAHIIDDAKHPDVFAVVGHYDCAGHNVPDAQHDMDIVATADALSQEIYGEGGRVVAIIAYPNPAESGPTWLFKQVGTPVLDIAPRHALAL